MTSRRTLGAKAGRRIAAQRLESHKSVQTLAAEAGIAYTTLFRLLKNPGNLKLDQLDALAGSLNVPATSLLNDEDAA